MSFPEQSLFLVPAPKIYVQLKRRMPLEYILIRPNFFFAVSLVLLCYQTQQSAAMDSNPLLLLSPPETDRAEAHSSSSHHHQQAKVNCLKDFKSFLDSKSDRLSHSSESLGDECKKGNIVLTDTDIQSKEELSLLDPEDKKFHLPRSSPVISRRSRPISWHGGVNDTSSPR